jgi:hypothetical protein
MAFVSNFSDELLLETIIGVVKRATGDTVFVNKATAISFSSHAS